ncbi:MAG: glucose 1-dehydrogenase [Nitrospinota bacterium]|nr:MAG: glucose 1-dehydrogenase [Nitrospinota bacterium]
MILEQFRLDGKVAIVTGAGRGLGKAMALALAEAGADVVVTARTATQIMETAEEIQKLGRRTLAIPTDVTSSQQVNSMVEQTISTLGHIDILINNAGGGLGLNKPVLELTDEEWHLGINTNLTGTFFCTRAVGKYLVEQQSGSVINISSGWGFRGGRNYIIYCSSKGGVIQFTRALAMEWARENIRVNCIAPGLFPTRPPRNEQEERRRLNAEKFTPLKRLGVPKELGPLAVFLASDASAYITGEVIVIDGGALAGGYAPMVD